MCRSHYSIALLGCLGACGNVDVSGTADADQAQRPRQAQERGATDESSPQETEPDSGPSSAPELPCELSDLAATYLFDSSEARGSITLAWNTARASEAIVMLELEGLAPETIVVPAGETSVLVGTRVQDAALSAHGEIGVRMSVELACGAVAQRDLAFEDPIRRCSIPSEDEIAGHEGDFYRCVDQWLAQGAGCGAGGYPLGYGAVYAERFYEQARPDVSARGKAWIDATLICLQESLKDAIALETSCAAVHDLAFASHPDCYADSGVCTLPLADLLIIPRTIAGKDLLSRDGLRQLLATAAECGQVYRDLPRQVVGPVALNMPPLP